MQSSTPIKNPLLIRCATIPFTDLKPELVHSAIVELITSTETDLELIKSASSPRTFVNTLQMLDNLGINLDFAMGIIGHMEAVATTPQWRAAYNEVLPIVSEFKSKIVLDGELWLAIKSFASTDEAASLTGHRKRFLKKTIDDFRRNGADLPPSEKAELATLNTELAQVTNKFSQHVLDATNQFEYLLKSEDDLRGLPDSARALGKSSAESKGVEGWRFTLQAPSFIPILTYLENRAVRELFYRAYNTRCTSGELENISLLYRILDLRNKKASLLGFKDFADLILADRMAKNGETASTFVDELRSRVAKHFQKEQEDLKDFVAKEFGSEAANLQPWDIAYYSEKMRMAQYDFDEEELRPYFALPKVMAGLFEVVERVFGITVLPTDDLQTWAQGVTTYSAFDSTSKELIGHFYADFYPRENKRSGAWMDSFITAITDPSDGLPHVGLIAGNFTPPRGDVPALLTHDEVTTLFHEFGHLMHLLCSNTELRGQSMNGVAWDFIELPSQILENWCWEREALDLFASHFQTGERLPDRLFDKVTKARNFRSASFLMRQVGFSTTDLALHRSYSKERDGDILPFTRDIIQKHSAAILPADFGMIATFTHLFSSPVAYAAAYYSYQWAEVLDADAFSRFKKDGLMNRATGLDFRNKILSQGDTEDPDILFQNFMGRQPDIAALLRRAGLE